MPAYEVTIEKTVRAAIPYDAADDAAAIERARELLERAIDQPEITEGGYIAFDMALCSLGSGQTLIDWK